jgi:hypothetical protein
VARHAKTKHITITPAKSRASGPCCEKCWHIVTRAAKFTRGKVTKWELRCAKGGDLTPCSDFDDATRSRSVMESGSRIFAR